jgi:vanillate O-demethylase ferredoxin subunit
VLFAGGIGITPILSMAQRLALLGKPFELHYSSRCAGRAAFVKRLQQVDLASNVHFYFADAGMGQRLDISVVLKQQCVQTHLYCAGLQGIWRLCSKWPAL